MTKYPIVKEDTEALGTSREYVKSHHSAWVKFAKSRSNDSTRVVFVTGVDRTKDWAVMTYSKTGHDNVTLRFNVTGGDTSATAWGSWELESGAVSGNCGPWVPIPSTPGVLWDDYNQCVFVRYYCMQSSSLWRRRADPEANFASAGPPDPPAADPKDEGLSEVESQSADSGESEPDIVAHNTVPVRPFSILSAHSSIPIDLL